MKFVAHPDQLPPSEQWVYARPDDPSDVPEQSWRQRLVTYNDERHNIFGLLEAYRLYGNQVYRELVERLTVPTIFILSAGWGLVHADYLLPAYDITFKKSAERYKYRAPDDKYNDFCHFRSDETGPVVFFGSKDYLPLLQRLTGFLTCEKVFFYASVHRPPEVPGWRAKRYERIHTNWHYSCAREFLKGTIAI